MTEVDTSAEAVKRLGHEISSFGCLGERGQSTLSALAAERDTLRRERDEARNAGLEEAALLAQDRWLQWSAEHGVECDFSACDDISEAIRALKSAPAPGPSVQEAAKVLLDAYDGFMSGKPETELVKSVSSAACFGAAAYEKGIGGQGVHALARSFLIALIDPTDEQLDYLRADPSAGKTAREASAALSALAQKEGE